MSCMTWSSKTWTQVNMIVKTWQPPQIWNPAFFFQDLAVPQVLKCYIFLQPHVPKPWQWLLYSRLGFPSLETFRGKAFQHYRPLPRIMSFMTWSSKTWTHLELFFQDLAATVLKSCMFSRLGIPSFEMLFCNSMSPSLDNDCTIQDLAFQLLKPFGPKNFNSISKNYAFSAFVFQDMKTSGNIFKTWQTKFGNLFFKTWYSKFWNVTFFATPCPQVLTMTALFKTCLAFQVLKLFGAKNFNIRPLPRIMSFMTWSSKTWTQVNMIVKTWQPPQFWNLTFFFQDLAISHVLNCYFFATPCPQDLTMIALFKTWLSKSWNFRVKTFNIRPLPRIMSFMTWSSKTWTHLEIFFKTWQPQFWNLTFFQDFEPKFWNVTFLNPMSPSLDNDCTIQDLAFQVLKLFGVKNFNIRPLPWIMSFMTWSSKTWTHLEICFKTWQPQLWNLTLFQDLESQVLKCVFWQFHVLKSWQWLHYSRLGFPTLEGFWAK